MFGGLGLQRKGVKACNSRRKVFKDVYSLVALRLRPQNKPPSRKIHTSVHMDKSHFYPQIVHVSLSLTISSLTTYQYTTINRAFFDVIMPDLNSKLLDIEASCLRCLGSLTSLRILENQPSPCKMRMHIILQKLVIS